MKGRQLAGTVHVHSNGRFVYSVNRADDTAGENSIAVYALDQATGEPTPIQHADTHSIHVRTFARWSRAAGCWLLRALSDQARVPARPSRGSPLA